ncbi:Fe-S cluster assembly protein NifU [candidate division KSB3 bacterium]|uniref:Nitrogen fixation protein NifU n=1 Tax=candidate division KSB3 bacterium TaxID=2044937 RepID=A0A2G6E5M9_9BACT|nr:MAG: Fe-S cluster assembly protein NifU [candidate division KSB3 bacterium]PIE29893.1 MAG: Fe-S cluster assembly protein NifU [candidate division KSB3 bacterium]
MWDYTDKVREHFFNPRNVGSIEDATTVAEVGSLACGDALKIYLKLDDNENIVDAKFETFGCGSAIASSSALTEMVKGLSLDEASKISNQDIAEFLGGLPEEKMHCSVMGREALEKAIALYRGQEYTDHNEDEGRIVCKCFGVTDKKIARVAKENHLTTVEQVTHYTKAGGGCTACHAEIEDIIAEVLEDKKRDAVRLDQKKRRKRLTNIQKITLIQETLENEIRPELQKDGGDIELIDIDGNNVIVALRGHCAGCPSSEYTLKLGVQEKLRELVAAEIVVMQEDDLEVMSW